MIPTTPPTSSADSKEIPAPLLILLQSLIAPALMAGFENSTIRPRGITLTNRGIDIELEAGAKTREQDGDKVQTKGMGLGMAQLFEGRFLIKLTVEETTPEETRFSLQTPASRGMEKLLNLGLKTFSGGLVNDMLARHGGEGLRLEGDKLVLEHDKIINRLLKR